LPLDLLLYLGFLPYLAHYPSRLTSRDENLLAGAFFFLETFGIGHALTLGHQIKVINKRQYVGKPFRRRARS
jgi:hypothetical protein